jgi:hypothetical protein
MPLQNLDEGVPVCTKKDARDDGVTLILGCIDQAVVPALKVRRAAIMAMINFRMQGFIKPTLHQSTPFGGMGKSNLIPILANDQGNQFRARVKKNL